MGLSEMILFQMREKRWRIDRIEDLSWTCGSIKRTIIHGQMREDDT